MTLPPDKSLNINRSPFFLSRWTESRGFDGVLFMILIVIYGIHRNPYPGFHDSLGYLSDAVEGYHLESNATNHLLYNAFQRTMVLTLPFLNPVALLSMISIAFSILSLLRLYELFKVMGFAQTTALAAISVFAFSFTWWQQTETIEVYTFNGFLFISMLRYAAEDLLSGKRSHLWRVSILLCLALLAHIQNILALPFFFAYIFSGKQISPVRRVGASALALSGIGLLVILALTLKYNTVRAVFFDNQFEQNLTSTDFALLGKGLLLSLGFFVYNFHLFGIFILQGCVRMWKQQRRFLLYLFLLFAPFWGFGIKFNVVDNHVFFLAAWIVLMIPLASAFEFWFSRSRALVSVLLAAAFVITPLVYMTAAKVAEKVPSLQEYAETKAYKGGLDHLLWPGKRLAPDPLRLANELCPKRPCPRVEWNFEAAVKYLELTGNRKGKRP